MMSLPCHEASDHFSKSAEDLIKSLQQDNKNLRVELSGVQSELKDSTDELAQVVQTKGTPAENFLIASLQAARASVTALDSANQELLDALNSRQEEIMRLSTAGMNLQQLYRL